MLLSLLTSFATIAVAQIIDTAINQIVERLLSHPDDQPSIVIQITIYRKDCD